MRRFILGMIIAVLFSLVVLATDFNGIGSEVPESYPVRNLNTKLNYTTIQEAIDAAETSDGHVIFVEKGMYYEHVIVNKQVSLTGETKSDTFIDGEGIDSVISIVADNVTITGFTIQNSGRTISGTIPDAGISVSKVSNCSVSGNSLIDNYVGVFVRPSKSATLADNLIAYNHIGIDINNQSNLNIVSRNTLQENNVSIHVYYADFNLFVGNNLTSNAVGIVARNSNNNTFHENDIKQGLDGILLDGSHFNTVSGNVVSELVCGIQLKAYANCNLISGNSVKNCSSAGIDLDESACYNSLSGNTIGTSEVGIDVSGWSGSNTVSGNHVASNIVGMQFWHADLHEVFENTIVENYAGAVIVHSQNNRFYHNTFLNNTQQLNTSGDWINYFDNGYPSGGNYWSDYAGVDLDPDGIGDYPYIVTPPQTPAELMQHDYYPLMGMFSDFNATSEYHVQTICNSTMSDFQFNGTAFCFNVSGKKDTAAFCRICIPKVLMNDSFRVFVSGAEILPAPAPLPFSNSTHRYLYFTYSHSTLRIVIIPEFPSLVIRSLFMIAALLAAIVYRKLRLSIRIQ